MAGNSGWEPGQGAYQHALNGSHNDENNNNNSTNNNNSATNNSVHRGHQFYGGAPYNPNLACVATQNLAQQPRSTSAMFPRHGQSSTFDPNQIPVSDKRGMIDQSSK